MIDSDRLQKALTYLATTDEPCADARTQMERAEFKAKAVKDAIFKRLDGSVADRQAEAGSAVEVRAPMTTTGPARAAEAGAAVVETAAPGAPAAAVKAPRLDRGVAPAAMVAKPVARTVAAAARMAGGRRVEVVGEPPEAASKTCRRRSARG